MKRLTVALALLPCWAVGCGDDTSGNSAASLGGTAESFSGDGDGDSLETGTASMTGDGDGDSSGDGDGDSSGDGDGDGDSGDGDGDSGDGDGDSGDGDGDSGDGDGDSGDGDGDTGDGDGDTSGDGDGDTSGDGDGDSGDACDEFQVTLDTLKPNVMLVLDKSRSMFVNYWDHDNNNNTATITRWNSLYQVVNNVVTTFDTQINFGANLFPSTDAQNVYGPAACLTSDFPEVSVLPDNAAAILAAIPAANVVNSYGGTPAATGIQTAYDHLLNFDDPRVMILVTDGAANCSQTAQNNTQLFEVYDSNLPIIVGQAHADGIDTYVVGVDIANMVVNDGVGGDPNNINPTVVLNAVAQAGGTGMFYNSQDQAQLSNAITNVIESVQSCTIPLEVPPFFPDFTKVFVDGMEWNMVNDCSNEDGWVYTNPNGPYDSIELCGAACDAVKVVGDADIEYHCNPG